MATNKNTSLTTTSGAEESKNVFPLSPSNPTNNHNHYKEQEKDLNTRVIADITDPVKNSTESYGNDLDSTMTGSDLDMLNSDPGDEQEDFGSEDEENNYYTLGGES